MTWQDKASGALFVQYRRARLKYSTACTPLNEDEDSRKNGGNFKK
jgi:hypothetical protein